MVLFAAGIRKPVCSGWKVGDGAFSYWNYSIDTMQAVFLLMRVEI